MKKLICIQIVLGIFFVLPVFSQDDSIDSSLAAVDTLQQDFGIFASDDLLNFSLRFDVSEYMRKKPKDEYLKAILTYHISDSDSINKEIRLKSRGQMRNEFCSFPPLSLNFKKADFQKADLKKIEKIKMVTHCKSGNEEYLFKEYLIYKLYNVLTDYSFKVRLAKVDYINTAKKNKVISSYSFLIEPLDIMAERMNSTPVESINLTQKKIIPEMLDRMALFNYMVGNTDWSVPGQHNCKVISVMNIEYPGLGAIVPYDFDYSGLVDAYYAIPAEGTGIESVRQRRYTGLCRSKEEYTVALKEFSQKKPEFYRIINEFPYLDERVKGRMISYLDEFYKDLESGSIINMIRSECIN